jgi:hypothetical protein
MEYFIQINYWDLFVEMLKIFAQLGKTIKNIEEEIGGRFCWFISF